MSYLTNKSFNVEQIEESQVSLFPSPLLENQLDFVLVEDLVCVVFGMAPLLGDEVDVVVAASPFSGLLRRRKSSIALPNSCASTKEPLRPSHTTLCWVSFVLFLPSVTFVGFFSLANDIWGAFFV